MPTPQVNSMCNGSYENAFALACPSIRSEIHWCSIRAMPGKRSGNSLHTCGCYREAKLDESVAATDRWTCTGASAAGRIRTAIALSCHYRWRSRPRTQKTRGCHSRYRACTKFAPFLSRASNVPRNTLTVWRGQCIADQVCAHRGSSSLAKKPGNL